MCIRDSPVTDAIDRVKRDGSVSDTLANVVSPAAPPFISGYNNLAVGSAYVYLIAQGFSAGPNVFHMPRFAVVDKSIGAYNQYTLPFLNLSSSPTLSEPRAWLGDMWVYKDGGIWGFYLETVRDFHPYPNGTYYISSAIIQLKNDGTVGTIKDVATCSVNFIWPGNLRARAAHGSQGGCIGHPMYMGPPYFGIECITNSGFFYLRSNCEMSNTGSIVTPANTKRQFETSPTSLIDYKGDPVLLVGPSFDTSENYLIKTGGVPTPAITPMDFDTVNRNPARTEIAVTWTKKAGVFRYRLKYRKAIEDSWTTLSIIDSDETPEDTYTGLDPSNDYYIRLDAETGRGLIEGNETHVP